MKTLYENMFERHPEPYSSQRTQEEHDREEAENRAMGYAGYDEYNDDEV